MSGEPVVPLDVNVLLALAIHRDGVLVASAGAWVVGDRVRLLAAA